MKIDLVNLMQHSRRIRVLITVLLISFIASTAQAAAVYSGADSLISVDGTAYQLVTQQPATDGPVIPDGTGLMWEWNSGTESWKSCVCMMTAFRALQTVMQVAGIENVENQSVNILTGWSTDGPEELFVDILGWEAGSGFLYADPITAATDLTLTDAWYEFNISGQIYRVQSLAENYAFTDDPSHDGYQEGWGFFDYRTYFKTALEMDATKEYFRDVVRSQIVENFSSTAGFDVQAVPVPSGLWLMGSGIGLLLLGRKNKPFIV